MSQELLASLIRDAFAKSRWLSDVAYRQVARLAIVPACGHMPFIERPEEFLRVVRPFLVATTAPAVESPLSPRRASSVVASS